MSRLTLRRLRATLSCLGVKAADRLISARCFKWVEPADMRRMSRGIARATPYLVCADGPPGALVDRSDGGDLRERLSPPRQPELF